ncbi:MULTISPECIES: hypothetical protein [unclassified Neochlamydia]|nr:MULTISPECIES: hypothetical protein [unclassified Neochlamydia]MBS4171232.1 hypothetical protein [Neochlamydia sp. AcF95]
MEHKRRYVALWATSYLNSITSQIDPAQEETMQQLAEVIKKEN